MDDDALVCRECPRDAALPGDREADVAEAGDLAQPLAARFWPAAVAPTRAAAGGLGSAAVWMRGRGFAPSTGAAAATGAAGGPGGPCDAGRGQGRRRRGLQDVAGDGILAGRGAGEGRALRRAGGRGKRGARFGNAVCRSVSGEFGRGAGARMRQSGAHAGGPRPTGACVGHDGVRRRAVREAGHDAERPDQSDRGSGAENG